MTEETGFYTGGKGQTTGLEGDSRNSLRGKGGKPDFERAGESGKDHGKKSCPEERQKKIGDEIAHTDVETQK